MINTVTTTAVISGVLVVANLLLTIFGGASQQMQYLKFALMLVTFLVILVGAYWFVARGSGQDM
jgi:predicted membrane-bound spermidine synthase